MTEQRANEQVLPLRVCISRAEQGDLRHLEWFGALSNQRPAIEAAFASQQRGAGVMLLARANGFPIGQVWVDYERKREDRIGIVSAVRVLPPLRGLGIASRLMMRAEADAGARSIASLELLVEFQNQAAYRLYARLGYELIDVDSVEYEYVTPAGLRLEGRVAGWIMRKHLPETGGRSTRPRPDEDSGRLARHA